MKENYKNELEDIKVKKIKNWVEVQKKVKKVLFASAKSVVGATKKRKKPYFIRTLKFHGAFPYPVV